MKRRIEVDVSGAVAQTSVPSVFAFSNGKHYAIIFTPRIKKLALAYFRMVTGSSDNFYFQLYIAGLALLLKPFLREIDDIILDTELYHQDRKVREYLGKRLGKNFDRQRISFMEIGHKSTAHFLAFGVFTKKTKPDRVINLEEIKEYLR